MSFILDHSLHLMSKEDQDEFKKLILIRGFHVSQWGAVRLTLETTDPKILELFQATYDELMKPYVFIVVNDTPPSGTVCPDRVYLEDKKGNFRTYLVRRDCLKAYL